MSQNRAYRTSDNRRVTTSAEIPAWCRNPILRGFVMGHAIAAPLLVILWAVTR